MKNLITKQERDNISWDQYFISISYLVAMKSKDPSTKVGCVIVGPDYEIRATGYNGFPRGIEDRVERYENKSYKYMNINHAEENAILNAVRVGTALKGCTLYTQWLPCSSCAKFIIQAGISEVIYHEYFPGNRVGTAKVGDGSNSSERWQNSMELSRELMGEASINVRSFAGSVLKLNGTYNGDTFEL